MSRLIRVLRPAIVAATALVLIGLTAGIGNAAPTHEAIEGTGSSWSGLAMQQWISDTSKANLRVTYTDSGSAQGRKDFAASNTDFGVTDIGYQCLPGQQCDVRDQGDTSSRPYAYLPIVGGGTAFPYNITVAGKRVTNLRLSGATLAAIFTNRITNWDDPAITRDNNGHALPSIPIIPVVHSEGAGTTAMFTRYLAKMFPGVWGPFNGGVDAMTEYFPRQGSQVAQYGSDGVQNLIAGSSGNGTIGYNEYAYALQAGTPVAKLENAAGYYTLPTQYNDAVALEQAQINMDKSSPDYLLQDLDNVYTDSDPRAYALSSYSYGLIPTSGTDPRMTPGKRQTLADFLFYAVCGGQKNIGAIGYSALPLNLVKASFQQITLLATAGSGVDISQESQNPTTACGNPTFDPNNLSANRLAEIDPAPPACDKDGAGPCLDNSGQSNTTVGTEGNGGSQTTGKGAQAHDSSTTSKTAKSPHSGSNGTTGGSVAVPTGSGTGPTTADTATTTGTKQNVKIDPVTGQQIQQAAQDTGLGSATPSPDVLAAGQRQMDAVPYGISAVALLVLLAAVPPLFVRFLRRGRR